MPRKDRKCNCEERVKVLEENLLLLKNLLVKGSVKIEGDLIVTGRITDPLGNLPNLGQDSISPCTALIAPKTFNINSAQPTCRTIIQELFITGPSRVLFGSLTNGEFVIINRSFIHTVGLYNLDSIDLNPVYQVPTGTRVTIVFTNGVITSITEPIPV